MARPRIERETRPPMSGDEYVSQFYINPKNLDTDNYHYRYVETHCMNEETQSVDKAIRDGYEPVLLSDLPEHAKTAEIIAKVKGRNESDPYVRTGRQILMRCPIALYKQKRKEERRDAKNQMNRVDWAEQSASIKAPTFVTENEYSRTQELSKAAARAFADDED